MTSPSPPSKRWLRFVLAATAVVFVVHAVYLYGVRFFDWVESDAAVPALMAADVLRTGRPVPTDWYYGNGDVWLFCTHLIALLPVALLGIGPASALAALVLGLALEIATLVWAYTQLCLRREVALFAALATLAAWSQFHIAFVYLQLSYGFHATVHAAVFTSFACFFARPGRPVVDPRIGLGIGLTLVFLVAAANPLRGVVFLLAPVLVGCAWPWRGVERRRRLVLALAAGASVGVGIVVYRLVFLRICAFTPWASHEVFALRNGAGILANLRMLGQGLFTLSGAHFFLAPGEVEGLSAAAFLGLVILLGALVLVARHVLGARTLTPLRFVAVAVVAQLGGSLAPLVLGNLMEAPHSIRYLMTSVLLVFGLAAILAVAALDVARSRRPALAWLALVPVGAAIAAARLASHPPVPGRNQWPDVAEQRQLVDELGKRGLRLGFSDNWNANLLTLLSKGAVKGCPVYFGDVLVPQRWNVETYCYDPKWVADRAERWFVLSYKSAPEEALAARTAALVDPVERFSVGPSYDIQVFETERSRLGWLALPIEDGDRMKFPFRLDAGHVLFKRVGAVEEGGAVVATGAGGIVVHGPYVRVPKGDYRVRWLGSGLDGPGDVAFDVAADGKLVVASRVTATSLAAIRNAELAALDFSLAALSVVELRLSSDLGGRVAFDGIVLEKR